MPALAVVPFRRVAVEGRAQGLISKWAHVWAYKWSALECVHWFARVWSVGASANLGCVPLTAVVTPGQSCCCRGREDMQSSSAARNAHPVLA